MEIAGDEVLDDIIDTAFMLARTSKHHNEIEAVKYGEIMTGMVQFRSYLMSGGYSLDQGVESAAKAAYLAAKLTTKNFDALERYEGGAVDFQFKSMPYNTLNRLRTLRTGSLYYLSKAASLYGHDYENNVNKFSKDKKGPLDPSRFDASKAVMKELDTAYSDFIAYLRLNYHEIDFKAFYEWEEDA